MTDEFRKQIVGKINREIDEKSSLKDKYQQADIMEMEPTVKKYLELLQEIKIIEDNLKQYVDHTGVFNDSLEKRITKAFNGEIFRRNYQGNCDCEHKIWVYEGSYYNETDFEGGAIEQRHVSEDVPYSFLQSVFKHNSYKCLECGQIVKKANGEWQKFEQNNCVLKINDNIDYDYYQILYFKLLYEGYSIEEAEQKVIEEFKIKGANNTLTRKKNNKKFNHWC